MLNEIFLNLKTKTTFLGYFKEGELQLHMRPLGMCDARFIHDLFCPTAF